MGTIDDTRKLLQDLITPDLKALEARGVALEQKMDLKFEHVDKRFVVLEQKMDLKFDHVDQRLVDLEQKINLKFEYFDKRFVDLERRMDLKFDLAAVTTAANHAAIMNALDINRRIERLESERTPPKELDRPY